MLFLIIIIEVRLRLIHKKQFVINLGSLMESSCLEVDTLFRGRGVTLAANPQAEGATLLRKTATQDLLSYEYQIMNEFFEFNELFCSTLTITFRLEQQKNEK